MGLRARVLVGLLAAVAVGLAVLFFGPPLPGPNVREWLGIANPPYLEPCTPREHLVRSPPRPEPAPGAWRPEPAPPVEWTELAGVGVDGVLLALTGQPTSRDLLTYDPEARRYRLETSLPVAVDHALVVEDRGDVYVVGGFLAPEEGEVAGVPTNRAWRRDAQTGRWTELPPMRHARGALTGAVVDGRVYAVSGGPNPFPVDLPPVRTVEIFDPAARRWSAGPPIPTPRHHAGAAVLDGHVYVAGGRQTGDYALDVVERLDPATGRWEEVAHLPLGVGDLRLVSAGGRVVAIGGDDETGWAGGGGYVSRAVWALAPEADEWERLPDLRRARHGFAAAVVDDRIYVLGGSPCPGHGFTATAESLRVP